MTDAERGYGEGAPWKGFTRYCCLFCKFDSMYEVIIREHVLKYHQMNLCSTPRTKQLSVPLYGPDNKLIEQREVTDAENSPDPDSR